MKRLRIVGLVNGGGTSPDERDARQFPSAKEAILYWRQSHGTRIDGKPNRPLTAFNVEIV